MNIKLFNENLPQLKELFTPELVNKNEDRLKFILEETQKSWEKNTNGLKNNKVKYLLICEAPPFSELGEPSYFYSQANTGFFTTIWEAFYPPEIIKKPKYQEEAYSKLIEKGFLLVDSLPFAMKYSSNHRRKVSYREILKNTFPFLLKNLDHEFEFDENLKIAFGFKINALQIINVSNGIIELTGRNFKISKSNIATDGSNYTSSSELRRVFEL